MNDSPLSDNEYRALARFRFALRTFLSFSADAARAVGVAPSQHQLLLAIRGHVGPPLSISAVADQLQVKLHSATELVARAEANGLVHRSTDPDDGRRVILQLTPRGGAILDELSVAHRDELRRFRREMNDVLRELDPQG
jgi:DNA-binding MarR family transcriptional regulator